MHSSAKSEATRLSHWFRTMPNAKMGFKWLGVLLVSASWLILSWYFLGIYLHSLDMNTSSVYALFRYLSGVLLELLFILLVAQLNFRFLFLKLYHQPNLLRNLYWTWIALLNLLWFYVLEWRTDYEPAYADENVLLSIVLTGVVIAYAYIADYFRTRGRQLSLLKEKTEAELHALSAQINPHFLFNTLNILYNSAQKNEDEPTAKLIHELSHLLRFSIQEARMLKTDLGKELAFLERYIQFQRLRLPEKPEIDVQTHLSDAPTDVQIAPLLLLPFVENAFQYGISLNEMCFVHLDIQFKGGILTMKLRNSVVPHFFSKKSLGTGIQNVRERLNLLYAQRHFLEIQHTTQEFTVELELDLSPH